MLNSHHSLLLLNDILLVLGQANPPSLSPLEEHLYWHHHFHHLIGIKTHGFSTLEEYMECCGVTLHAFLACL